MFKRISSGLRGKISLFLVSLLLLVLLVTSYASYWQTQHIAMELEQSKFTLLKSQLQAELAGQRKTLLSLHDVPPISAIVRARAHGGIDPESGDSLAEWKNRLSVIFRSFLINHPLLYQIRYLDSHGIELVRVEQKSDGRIVVTPDDAMQDKGGRFYISETLKLQAGEIYHSDVDLNREHGVVETPFVPVMRLATPVYAGSEKPQGLIIVNLLADPLFEMVASDASLGVRRHVVNAEGDYIKHSDPMKTFAWQRGKHYKFEHEEPELAGLARQQESLIRFHDVHNEVDGFDKVYFSPGDNSRYWLLTLHVPETLVFTEVSEILQRMLMISAVIGLLLLLPVFWFVSKKVVLPVVELADATDRLRQGDLSVRVDEDRVEYEFRTLYRGLNAFAENQQHATRRLEAQVEAQTRRLAAVIDHIVDGIITITEDATIQTFNPAARNIFGYGEDEVIGRNVNMLMPEPYHSAHDGYLAHYLSSGEKKVIGIGREVRGRRKDGSEFPLDLAINEIMVNDRRYFVGIIRDITERKAYEEKIHRMAHHDHLTGLPNRAMFNDRIGQAIKLANRYKEQLALLFIDLDGFKAVNDTLGHEAGDALLKEVAVRLNGCVRQADTVARMGGDEFAVILSDVKDNNIVTEKSALIIEKVSAPYPEIDEQCSIGCSIGIAIYPDDAGSHKQLLSKADAAMYVVKEHGKNHYRFYQQDEGS